MQSHAVEVDEQALRAWPLPIPSGGDKEARGRVLIVAGSREIPGAAVLAATAALRAGAGKVAIATCASIAQAIGLAVPESRVIALDEDEKGEIAGGATQRLEELVGLARAVLIGPGLRNAAGTWGHAADLLRTFSGCGLVLDAGAMGVATAKGGDGGHFDSPVLMTPHAGEMASLSGADKDEVAANAPEVALRAAARWNACVILKGEITHIASPNGRLWRHEGGNVGLATSGSGDVLSGIMAGLLARGAPLEQAAVWGVALHARAGDRLADRMGLLGYLARELPGEVPAVMGLLGERC